MTVHHVVYATRDLAATVHFYEDLMGFPLVHTEVDVHAPDIWVRHAFFDTSPETDGGSDYLAFFEFQGVGEEPEWATDVSAAVGLPFWINHCAFEATAEQQQAAKRRLGDEGIEPTMEVDHGWCHSVYFTDPNGIMVELCRNTPGFVADRAEAHRLAAIARDAVAAEGGG